MLKTKIIIFISLISFANGFSQEAENIFHKEYSKLSFVFQPSILKKSDAWNRDGSTYPKMKFTNDFSYQFGVYYNFAQSGNFNFNNQSKTIEIVFSSLKQGTIMLNFI